MFTYAYPGTRYRVPGYLPIRIPAMPGEPTDDARLAAWLPAFESHLQASESSKNGTSQLASESVAVPAAGAVNEQTVKQYLHQEAVPLLTQALMDLCMEETQPPEGQTIPWLINWLEKRRGTDGAGSK